MLILTLCIIFGLEINIINYLWFSTVRLIVYYLRSLYRWVLFLVGFQLGFFFYLYGLEVQFFFSAFSKLFYLGCLLWTNIIGRELYLMLRYVLAVYGLLNYMLIGRVYFFSFTIIGQYYFCFLLLLVYLISFHELSLFSLIIRFPLSLVFYLKLGLIYLGCFYIFCLFLFPVFLSLQVGNFPMNEEFLISFFLIFLYF